MAEVFKRLYQGQVAATATTLYTAPGSTSVIIKHIRIANPTATARTIKLWQGGTADVNVIMPETTIDAGGFAEFDGVIIMDAAQTFSGIASAATALTVTIYGLEIS